MGKRQIWENIKNALSKMTFIGDGRILFDDHSFSVTGYLPILYQYLNVPLTIVYKSE